MSSPKPLCGALAGFTLVRFLVFWIIANRFPDRRTAWTSRPEYSICKKYDDGSEPAVEEIKDESSEDRAYNNSIKKRIQDHDAFDEVEVNNPDLLNHQKAGCLLASRYNKFAFFYDTATGKTVMTLSIIKEKQQKEDAHFLILTLKAIIKTAWMDDSRDFFPDLRILPISNNFYFDDCRPIYCHLGLGLIYQSKSDYENFTPETLFDLLHEIRHLELNTDGMTSQEEEFFATQWALERMKLYDFQLPKKRQKEFDEYINGYRSRRNRILTSKNATNLDWDE